MKIFKLILDFISLSILTTILILFCLRENEELIPNSKYILEISSWDHKFSKKELFKTINDFAKKENISIYKVFPNYKNEKDIYIFNDNNDQYFEFIANHFNINKLNGEEILKKDIRGKYFVTQNRFNDKHLIKSLSSMGLKIEIFKVNRLILFLETINNYFLFVPFVSIIIIYLTYYIFEKNKKFKELSIKKLNGYSFLSIIFEKAHIKSFYWLTLIIFQSLLFFIILSLMNLNENYLLFLKRLVILSLSFIFIISIINLLTHIMTFNLDIASMIKGREHYKAIRFITTGSKCVIFFLLTLLILQNLATITELKKIKDSERYWTLLKDYYSIELTPIKVSENEKKLKAYKFHQLIKNSESKKNVILIRNNNIYNPKIDNYDPYNGNILYVNQNFLDLYSKKTLSIKSFKDQSNSIEIMLPKISSNQFNKIKDAFLEWNYFQNEFKNKLNITMMSTYNNYDIFSFDNRTEDSFKFLNSPAIVLINSNDLADDFYYASLSQGTYLFKDYKDIEKNIKSLQLTNYISGITNYTDSIAQNLRETNLKLIIVMCSVLLLIIIGITTIILDIQYYFEQNKRELLIKRLFGLNIYQVNLKYISLNLIITWTIGAICYFYIKNNWIIFIYLVITIIQLLVQCLQIVSLNHSYTKKILEL